MRKNKFYTDFSLEEIKEAHTIMHREMQELDFKHPIRLLFLIAWEDFINNGFSFDGPTFVNSRFKKRWELASFIHDWRNSKGFVSYKIDEEFFSIMITLNYTIDLIIKRWFYTRFTFLNIIRHKLKSTYKKETPKNIYLINLLKT